MRAYIDESGDPGTRGNGSRWLVFGCVMVSEEEVLASREAAQKALQEVHRGSILQFAKLNHDEKLAANRIFKEAPWYGVLLARDTQKVDQSSPRSHSESMYQYMAAYVLERVSRRAAKLQEKASVYFEEGRHLNNNKLMQFQEFLKNMVNNGALQIDKQWLSTESIYTVPKREAPKLEHEILFIADGLAHSGFKSFERDRTSRRNERSYFAELVERLWGRNLVDEVNIYDCGLILRPKRRWSQYQEEFPWLVLSLS